MNIYQEEGYKNRKEYLQELAEEYDVPFRIVWGFAQTLGKDEDFDGLPASLEDMAGLF